MEEKIKKAIEIIEKTFGKGTVQTFNTNTDYSIKRVPTGSLSLDIITGGGWPKGRIIEIFGPESSGKSTITLHAIAEVQKQGGIAAYIDTEHAFDPIYAENLGVSLEEDKFIFSQPDNGEQAFTIAEELLKSEKVGIIVIDSVAALTPKAEIEGDFGDSKMGLHARLMSQGMRKLTGIINRTDCIFIFTNQLRDKIGVMFGNPETTTGGNALKFYASLRLDVRRKSIEKDGESTAISSNVKLKTVKNKTYPPFKETEVSIVFGEGIDRLSEIINISTELNIIKKSGSWYSYGEIKLGQGEEKVAQLLRDNPDLAIELENKIKNEYGI